MSIGISSFAALNVGRCRQFIKVPIVETISDYKTVVTTTSPSTLRSSNSDRSCCANIVPTRSEEQRQLSATLCVGYPNAILVE